MDIGYAKLPIPGGGQAPTTPGDLAAFAQAVDPHLVHHVADEAERDSLLDDAPVHTIASAANGTLWKKTSSTETPWVTLWEPLPAWRPVSLAAGVGQSGDVTPSIRVVGGRVYLQGAVSKADGTVFSGDSIKVGSVPTDCVPEQVRRYVAACSMAGDTTDGACRIEVTGKTNASPGDILVWYQATGGTPWVDLSGGYWMDF
ncbi:hypothetical protein ACWC4J_03665 [Streptomyces sp. NPDC001356]